MAVPGPTDKRERANRSAASPGNFTTVLFPKSPHVQIGTCLYSAAVAATLTVAQISVRYADTLAVDGVSFDVNPGEIVALLGANGAGKTSIVESCIGLRRPTSGQITAFGMDPTDVPAKRWPVPLGSPAGVAELPRQALPDTSRTTRPSRGGRDRP